MITDEDRKKAHKFVSDYESTNGHKPEPVKVQVPVEEGSFTNNPDYTYAPNPGKGALSSKTLIFNGLLILVGAASQFVPFLQGHISDSTLGLIVSGIGFIGVVLRFVTNSPIK